MKSIIAFILFTISIAFVYSESTNKKSKEPSRNENYKISTGFKILKNKNIQITLPNEKGYRKDLYDSNGNLLESEFLNATGTLIEFEKGIAVEKRNYNSLGFLEKLQAFDKAGKNTSTSLFQYDPKCTEIKKQESCLSQISFLDSSQNPTEDEYGIYKYKAEYDSNCLALEKRKAEDCRKLEVNLNKNMKLTEDNIGNAKIIRTFDTQGNLNLYEIYDKAAKVKHKVIYAYDYKCIEITSKPLGCIIFQEYSNRIDSKKNSENVNYGKRIIKYDLNCVKEKHNAENCISLEENYDLNGKLKDIAHRFTFGCMDYSLELGAYAKKMENFDNKGNVVLREFYNSKSQLIEDSSGGAKYVFAYNQECLQNGMKPQHCRTLSEIYDKNQKLKYKAIYDENCVKTGKAILESPNYCTAWKEVYDSVVEEANPKDSVKIIKANFDKNGFKVDLEQYNINRKLSMKTVYFFDKEKLIKKENQDVNGNRVEDGEGIATYLYQYENSKFTTREETLDKNGKLKPNSDGVARMVFLYNDSCLKNNSNRYECATLTEFYDENENLIEPLTKSEDNNNYAKLIREFDTKGNLILEAYYDKNHKLKKNQKGIAKYKFYYDDRGEVIREDHFTKKNSLKKRIQYQYDPKCKSLANDFSCNTSIVYLDKKNSLLDKEKLEGIPYAKEITTYNYECIQTTSEPDECLEKKEFINSKEEIIFGEYYQYKKPPTPQSEIKLIKIKMTQEKIPYSVEFIK